MDPREIAHIGSNLFNLTKCLDYDHNLTAFLQQKGHIGKWDTEAMNILKNSQGNAAAIQDLLRRLNGRPGSYQSLIEAARALDQENAVTILEALYTKSESKISGQIKNDTGDNLDCEYPGEDEGARYDPNDPYDIPAEVLDFIKSKDALDVVVELPAKPFDIVDGYDIPTTGQKGLALILDIVAFDDEKFWKRRNGSDKDVENLTELLSQLKYEIHPKSKRERQKERKTKREIKEHIQEFVGRCEAVKPPSIIVFIGSHGFHPNKIVTSDPIGRDAHGKGYYITLDLYEDIVQEFFHENCPSMKGKPKIFIVQACQEFFRNETDGSALEEPKITDAIICTAEMPGGKANRDKHKGSWFVHCFTYMMMKHAKDKSFQEIMEMVEVMLGKLNVSKGIKQIPLITVRELKTLYFPMHPEKL